MSSSSEFELLSDHVASVLRVRGNDFLNLHRYILHKIENFMNSIDGKGVVYRVYTRADKQKDVGPYSDFKETWKIVSEILLNRRGGFTERAGEMVEIKPNPTFDVTNIDDVVGVTVVCIFPSDMRKVQAFVDKQVNSGALKQLKFVDHTTKNKGYYAYHYVLTEEGNPFVKDLRCELQIKTAIHDAWGTKTHDLTYKPRGELDFRIRRQMNTIARSLAATDDQSDIFREMMEDQWFFDKSRKEAARKQIVINLSGRGIEEVENREKKYKLRSILDLIQNNEEFIATCEYGDNQLSRLMSAVEVYAKEEEADHNLCRLAALIAMTREINDLNAWAFKYIYQWKAFGKEIEENIRSCIFEGLIHFCFGNIEESIRSTNVAVQLVDTHNVVPLGVAMAKADLAYYYSEIAGSPLATKYSAEENARRLVKEALEAVPEEPQILDTEGAVWIAFGISDSEVQEGLDKCTAAWNLIKSDARFTEEDKEVAKQFYEIHQRKAQSRLLRGLPKSKHN